MDIEKTEKFLDVLGEPKYRLSQIKKAVFQDGVSDFSQIYNLSKQLREKLDREIKILSFTPENILVSKNEDSFKALLKLKDNNFIETVLLSAKPGLWSVCLSTQVGCPLNCSFCATGQSGFKRNLTAEEITDQVLLWKQYLKTQNSKLKEQNPKDKIQNSKFKIKNSHISNVVFMGMGEPLLNWENVKESLEDLIDPELFGFGSRSISVSTCGIPENIVKMQKYFPQINLAISLHFADDQKRSQFMPINKKHNLKDLSHSFNQYFESSKRKVFLEYILLASLNDSEKDALDLVKFIKSIRNNYLLHVNLIEYNQTYNKYSGSSRSKIEKFKNYLLNNHISVTTRKSLGQEIQGACGQLAGKK